MVDYQIIKINNPILFDYTIDKLNTVNYICSINNYPWVYPTEKKEKNKN